LNNSEFNEYFLLKNQCKIEDYYDNFLIIDEEDSRDLIGDSPKDNYEND